MDIAGTGNDTGGADNCMALEYRRLADDLCYRRVGAVDCWTAHHLVLYQERAAGVLRAAA